MCEIREKVRQVNQLLLEGEPNNTTTDHKGYSGYSPQSITDAMNKVFAFGEWGFEELENEIHNATDKSVHCVAKVQVWLAVEGQKLPFQPTAWGEGTQPAHAVGDARKSACTDALKKALSYFSVGSRAYHGLLKK